MESASIAASDPQGAAAGDKGLKTGALGYLSNLVIGVASTAPGYSLAATLGFVVAVGGMGFHAPAVMIVSFIPMLLIAAAYYYMNKADPDCGTSFTWVTRAMGPRLGWLTGWAIVVADVIVMAALAYIAGVYTFLLFGLDAAATNLLDVSIVAAIWIIVMTCDLLHRHRALGPHPVRPARRRDRGAGPVLGGRARQGLLRRSGRLPRPGGLVQPVHAPWRQHRAGRRRPPGRVHLLGLGQRRLRQRGIQGQRQRARAGRSHEHDPARPDLRGGGHRGPGLRRHDLPEAPRRRRAQRAGRAGPRLAARQAPDHRRAHLGLGIDADDDPADRQDHAVDGPLRLDPQDLRADPPALSDARRLDARDGRRLADLDAGHHQRQPERAQRLDHRDRLPDRLLLRAHRLRLRRLLPQGALQELQELHHGRSGALPRRRRC